MSKIQINQIKPGIVVYIKIERFEGSVILEGNFTVARWSWSPANKYTLQLNEKVNLIDNAVNLDHVISIVEPGKGSHMDLYHELNTFDGYPQMVKNYLLDERSRGEFHDYFNLHMFKYVSTSGSKKRFKKRLNSFMRRNRINFKTRMAIEASFWEEESDTYFDTRFDDI